MLTLRICYRVAIDAYYKFLADDGWAIASHIALSALMSLFPFLILVTALAGFLFGSTQLADEVASILLQAWPTEVAVADRATKSATCCSARAATCSPSASRSRSISPRAASRACASG